MLAEHEMVSGSRPFGHEGSQDTLLSRGRTLRAWDRLRWPEGAALSGAAEPTAQQGPAAPRVLPGLRWSSSRDHRPSWEAGSRSPELAEVTAGGDCGSQAPGAFQVYMLRGFRLVISMLCLVISMLC